MIEDLTWFGIKWNQGPSSDDFYKDKDNNQNDNKIIKEFNDNKTIGKKQRKKMKKNEKNPEQSETDFNNKNLIKSQHKEDDDKSLLRMKNIPQEFEGTFFAKNACQVRISSAFTYVKNSNMIENENTYDNKNENENDNENENENENEKVMENSKDNICNENKNNENFLFTANLGLFTNVYCQSKRIPCYLAAWKFLLKKKLSKIILLNRFIIN